jgi:hypothetical protein
MPVLTLSLLLMASLGDRTAELQRMINRCSSDGSVEFPQGIILVSTLQLKPHCTYRGAPAGTTLRLLAHNGFVFDISERESITIKGISIDGQGVGGGIIAQGNAPVRNIHVDNCDFTGVSAAAHYPANVTIVSTWGIIDSGFTNNRFHQISGGIALTTVQNVAITGNTFEDVTQSDAIFIAPNPVTFPAGDNLRVTGNAGEGLAKMGIEIFRPDPPNGSRLVAPLIENNRFRRFLARDGEGMGLSITHGDGALIRNNDVENTTGTYQGVGIGIEVIVRNATVRGNRIGRGFAYGIVVQGTPANTIEANTITGVGSDGILFACDPGRNRCDGRDSTIANNTITNAHLNGIRFANNWSGSRVLNNVITRDGGAWPDDPKIAFTAIRAPQPEAPSEVRSNRIERKSTGPAGFRFNEIDSSR